MGNWTPTPKHLYQEIASAVQARLGCLSEHANESQKEYAPVWTERINRMVQEFMPSGNGWDCGTKIDLSESHAEKLVFFGSYHHMNDGGFYDGWTEHTIVVTPSFNGLNIRVSGRNRNDIKDYLWETFECALTQLVVWNVEKADYVMVS
jgi:hypothetical protein